ncbi:MAG: hypothetical protein K6U08_00245 [Firmicutes bacterium]|nr:hypothetical protein [Bacillota bacterium]
MLELGLVGGLDADREALRTPADRRLARVGRPGRVDPGQDEGGLGPADVDADVDVLSGVDSVLPGV